MVQIMVEAFVGGMQYAEPQQRVSSIFCAVDAADASLFSSCIQLQIDLIEFHHLCISNSFWLMSQFLLRVCSTEELLMATSENLWNL